MIRKRLSRLGILLTSAALLTMVLGTGVAYARNPSWATSFDKLPTSVSAGNDAGWFVTVTNNGPSNINDLNITITSEVAGALPSYISDLVLSSGGTEQCSDATGKLVCNVGTLADDQTVKFTVAFLVPAGTTGSFDLNIGLLAGTGDSGSDGGNSRGDSKTFTSSTGINSSTNQDSGFVVNDGSFLTTGSLGRNNKQTTALDTTDLQIPVTITDGISSFPCNSCGNLVGEWSVLDVNGGVNTNAIKVTLVIWVDRCRGGVSASQLYLIHADGLGGFTTVNNLCNPTHSNLDCLDGPAVKIGNNFKIVAWLAHNGGLRGGY